MPGKKYVIIDCEGSVFWYIPHPLTVILKDESLPGALNRLSKNPNVSIIIVTAYHDTHFLEKHLKKELTETPFSIVYAPPLHHNKKTITQHEKIKTTPASISPPPGYTLLFNHTVPGPKIGWENYAEILWQRFTNTDFYKLQEQQELERKELERKELERKELERKELEQKELKKREKEEKLSVSLEEYSSSLRFFTPTGIFSAQIGTNVIHSLSPETVGSSEMRRTMTPSPSHMQHIIEKTSSSSYFKPIVDNGAHVKKTPPPPPCRIQCIKKEEAQNPSGSFRSYSPSALSSS